jgi:hypothetical protein
VPTVGALAIDGLAVSPAPRFDSTPTTTATTTTAPAATNGRERVDPVLGGASGADRRKLNESSSCRDTEGGTAEGTPGHGLARIALRRQGRPSRVGALGPLTPSGDRAKRPSIYTQCWAALLIARYGQSAMLMR